MYIYMHACMHLHRPGVGRLRTRSANARRVVKQHVALAVGNRAVGIRARVRPAGVVVRVAVVVARVVAHVHVHLVAVGSGGVPAVAGPVSDRPVRQHAGEAAVAGVRADADALAHRGAGGVVGARVLLDQRACLDVVASVLAVARSLADGGRALPRAALLAEVAAVHGLVLAPADEVVGGSGLACGADGRRGGLWRGRRLRGRRLGGGGGRFCRLGGCGCGCGGGGSTGCCRWWWRAGGTSTASSGCRRR
mmetsp:Transcript_4353/g.12496  ORF Transcript_4353/g.12496 Transcript_4353/m.12496 type:complete len:250 (+) Transcript_4353:106-855(+)